MNRKKRNNRYLSIAGLIIPAMMAILLSGCLTFGRKEFQPPEASLPDQWQTRPVSGEQVLAASRWWEVFQDPALNQLIEAVLKTNNDMAVATINVRMARLKAGLAREDLLPDLSASISSGKSRNFETGISSDSSGASLGLSWEADLWGRLAESRDAADWEAKATELDRAYTALSLVKTTADLYWQIAYLNEAIADSREGIDYTRRTRELVRVKYDAGSVSELDLVQAEQDEESQKADLADLERQMNEARNALAVLFDQAPGPVMADPEKLVDMPLPILDAGIPAAVLGNRPDLKAAEFRLRSTLAEENATRTGYYPNVSLTAGLGTSSSELLNLIENPVGTLGAGLALPFIQWKEMRLNTRLAEAEYEQAVIEFRQTLYEAFQDVADALSARASYITQESALRRLCTLARKSEAMAEVRYRTGKTGVQDWLDQQERRRAADLSLSKNRYNQLTNLMTLYVALGGDTDLAEPLP